MTSETPNRRRNRILTVVAIGVAGILAMALSANLIAGVVGGTAQPPVEPGLPRTISIAPGSSASTIYRLLADEGVVPYADIERAARQADAESKLQPGTYAFETGMPASEVLRMLLEGGTAVDSRTITVVEGWTVDRIVTQLGELTEFDRSDFVNALESGAVTSGLLPLGKEGVSDLQRWEGLLYPAKYQIPIGSTPAGMLQPMADEMIRRFESVDWSTLGDRGLSRYEILIVASLIERESGTEADRALISSVIHNRLSIDMRLQIDATVIYALGTNPGRVTAEDLKIDSPYNTYVVDGLPPTPIGAVSTPSLVAALQPADTEFLFYVLADKDGSHAFAVTYEEHQANVQAAREAGVLP